VDFHRHSGQADLRGVETGIVHRQITVAPGRYGQDDYGSKVSRLVQWFHMARFLSTFKLLLYGTLPPLQRKDIE
jgi:hypothetical protein